MSEKFEKQVISMLTEQGKEIEKVRKTLEKHSKILEEHGKILEKHDDDIESLKRAVINIEDAVTTKIPALFDAFSANLDKHKQYDKRINNLEITVEDHSNRISVLEHITSRK